MSALVSSPSNQTYHLNDIILSTHFFPILTIFHPVLFHRTTGKFTHQRESSYSVGTVGYENVDGECIDHTYLRTSSPGLDSLLKGKVAVFSGQLKQSTGLRSGQISLEFFQQINLVTLPPGEYSMEGVDCASRGCESDK